jgi:uncharacterized membrane-anchored protein
MPYYVQLIVSGVVMGSALYAVDKRRPQGQADRPDDRWTWNKFIQWIGACIGSTFILGCVLLVVRSIFS